MHISAIQSILMKCVDQITCKLLKKVKARLDAVINFDCL